MFSHQYTNDNPNWRDDSKDEEVYNDMQLLNSTIEHFHADAEMYRNIMQRNCKEQLPYILNS